MSKDEKRKALVPRLRFPEFVGQPVRKLQLEDVTAESKLRNGETLPPTSVMGVTKAEGIVPMEERLIAPDIARYKLVRKNWFAYNPMRLNIGSIARWKGDSDILVSPDYVVFKCLEHDEPGIYPAYLDHFRQTDRWENFVTEGGDGSVRIRIYYKDIARLQLALPSPAEQLKIADCLGSLNDLIAAQRRKLAALRDHKKGLMQQLFPREGETRPSLRFPEFRNAGEWQSRSLSDFLTERNECPDSAVPLYSLTIDDGVTPKTKRYERAFLVKDEDSAYKVMHPNDFAFNPMNLRFGAIGRHRGDESVAVSKYYNIFYCDSSASPVFCEFYFGSDRMVRFYDDVAIGSLVEKRRVHFSDFLKFRMRFPVFDEQQHIANCLSTLDTQITAQAKKLDALHTHKRGLMQQLFPSPEDAAA